MPASLRTPSRRELLGLAAAGGAGAVLAACGGDGDGEREAERARERRAAESDIRILNRLLEMERTAVVAYETGERLLRGRLAELAAKLAEQERRHAGELVRLIREDLGGRPARAASDESIREGFPPLRTPRDFLRFALDVESTAIAAYREALPKLSAGNLRGTAAATLTVEAEHGALLLEALGRSPVPTAFVTGKEPA